MSLLIISNRLPSSLTIEGNDFTLHNSSGGLVTGMKSYLASFEDSQKPGYKWIGWPGDTIPDNLKKPIIDKLNKNSLYPVNLSPEIMDNFYLGFCNKTLWPLFHYFLVYTSYDNEQWQTYNYVNEAFCNEVLKIYKPGDKIWIHDYHLMLLPQLLRSKIPDAEIGFFLHIPFPSYETFRMLPKLWRENILHGLLGSDLIGFHTYDYQKYFTHSVQRILGFESNAGLINLPYRIVKTDNFPMGIDFNGFADASQSSEAVEELNKISRLFKGRKVILSIDRLDYTKGIINRLKGFEKFLNDYPQWHAKVNLIMIVIPSRIGVDRYDLMKKEIDEMVGYINGKFGNIHWIPINYQFQSVDMNTLAGFYKASDVALITPLRDGMNLISKEYIACKTDKTGVLILSEMTGSSRELGEAIIINPNNEIEISEAIKQALQMPIDEQILRNTIMQARLRRYNVNRWAKYFLEALDNIKAVQKNWEMKLLVDENLIKIYKNYRNSVNSVFLLDYDGTLVQFDSNPDKAVPPPELLSLLKKLSEQKNTDVVIISGRSKQFLDKCFNILNITISAEHGAWLKQKQGNWKLQNIYTRDWKEIIYPYLEYYTDILPGSFIEEKDFSLVFHFRKSDPEQSSVKAKELHDELNDITAKLDLQVIPGHKIIEIRNKGISKGDITAKLLAANKYDFIFCAGDDWTDEDMFKALPPNADSVKIGISSTYAKYNLENCNDLIEILKQFINVKSNLNGIKSINEKELLLM
ncbi:MAG: bifunctional alpha,alpha-trehalose-phosphate synthase (UDP-forming)/trehalose-phosphatase [Ignavibacteria bacterium]|nr:bifunctional alpha,alpha-trehalose-phosphate synthase (UDP-forming)/trehalose-phosphatase [Ignavibacteria bacterium]